MSAFSDKLHFEFPFTTSDFHMAADGKHEGIASTLFLQQYLMCVWNSKIRFHLWQFRISHQGVGASKLYKNQRIYAKENVLSVYILFHFI